MNIVHNARIYRAAAYTRQQLVADGVPVEKIDAAHRAIASDRIDEAAGRARSRFVSPGHLVEEEYRAARDAVQRWRDAGSPGDDVPPEIAAGAEYSDTTPENAAVEIEQTGTAFEQALASIRAARLAGKRAVSQAEGDDIDAAADAAIAQLNAIQPPAP